MRYLSSFESVIAIDTDTKIIGSEVVSESVHIPYAVKSDTNQVSYFVEPQPHGAITKKQPDLIKEFDQMRNDYFNDPKNRSFRYV